MATDQALVDLIYKNFGHEVFTPGLQRTKPLYEGFKKYFETHSIPVVIIAGTNGKGETAHSLNHLLINHGVHSSLWTSPHIHSLCERYNYDGEDVSLEILSKVVIESLPEIQKLDFKVSFYEFLFYVFLKIAKDHIEKSLLEDPKAKHVVLLEVGLGGRLDAVNHFDAHLVLLASISRDHKEILGNRYDLILSEKLGVLRDHQQMVSALELRYLQEKCSETVSKFKNVHWVDLFKAQQLNCRDHYSYRNQVLALMGFKKLLMSLGRLDESVKNMTVADVEFPKFKGRQEKMTYKNNEYIFIGAHNLDGMRKLMELPLAFEERLGELKLLVSFSKRDADETFQMLKMIDARFGVTDKKIIVTVFNHPKAQSEDIVFEMCKKFSNMSFELSWTNYLKELNDTENKNTILVTGSYYFIGEVQKFLHS